MHWGYGILDFHPVSPISTFLHTFVTCHIHFWCSFALILPHSRLFPRIAERARIGGDARAFAKSAKYFFTIGFL